MNMLVLLSLIAGFHPPAIFAQAHVTTQQPTTSFFTSSQPKQTVVALNPNPNPDHIPILLRPRSDNNDDDNQTRNLTAECLESYFAIEHSLRAAYPQPEYSATTNALGSYLLTRTYPSQPPRSAVQASLQSAYPTFIYTFTTGTTTVAPSSGDGPPTPVPQLSISTRPPTPQEVTSICSIILQGGISIIGTPSPPPPDVADDYEAYLSTRASIYSSWGSVARSVGSQCTASTALPLAGWQLLLNYATDVEQCSTAYRSLFEVHAGYMVEHPGDMPGLYWGREEGQEGRPPTSIMAPVAAVTTGTGTGSGITSAPGGAGSGSGLATSTSTSTSDAAAGASLMMAGWERVGLGRRMVVGLVMIFYALFWVI